MQPAFIILPTAVNVPLSLQHLQIRKPTTGDLYRGPVKNEVHRRVSQLKKIPGSVPTQVTPPSIYIPPNKRRTTTNPAYTPPTHKCKFTSSRMQIYRYPRLTSCHRQFGREWHRARNVANW